MDLRCGRLGSRAGLDRTAEQQAPRRRWRCRGTGARVRGCSKLVVTERSTIKCVSVPGGRRSNELDAISRVLATCEVLRGLLCRPPEACCSPPQRRADASKLARDDNDRVFGKYADLVAAAVAAAFELCRTSRSILEGPPSRELQRGT